MLKNYTLTSKHVKLIQRLKDKCMFHMWITEYFYNVELKKAFRLSIALPWSAVESCPWHRAI